MSDIIIEQVTASARHITIPDFSSQFTQIEEQKKLAEELKSASTKHVEIMKESIVDQISIYLSELYKPILTWCNNNKLTTIELGSMLGFADGRRFSFKITSTPQGNYVFRIQTYECNWNIMINQDGTYEQHGTSTDADIQSLAENWHNTKVNCANQIQRITKYLFSSAQEQSKAYQRKIDALNKFQL